MLISIYTIFLQNLLNLLKVTTHYMFCMDFCNLTTLNIFVLEQLRLSVSPSQRLTGKIHMGLQKVLRDPLLKHASPSFEFYTCGLKMHRHV